MNKEALVKEVSINAPVARVWEALTTKDQIQQWSFGIDGFEPVPGFEFSFEGGKNGQSFKHRCVVKEVIENKKLSYSWSYENIPGVETLVTVELFEEGNGTRVKLTHAGLEQFPQDENFARGNFDAGWEQIVCKQLKEHVEKG